MWNFKVQTRSSLCIAAVYTPQPRAIADFSSNLCQNLTRHSYIDIYINFCSKYTSEQELPFISSSLLERR